MFRPLTRAWRVLPPSKASLSRRDTSQGARGNINPINKVTVVTGSINGINFTIAQCLAQDRAHVVGSSRKQEKVIWAGAALQREGLSMTGTVCHMRKGEDWERLVATTWKD